MLLLGGLVGVLALLVSAAFAATPAFAATAASAPSAIFAIAGDGTSCSSPPACGDGGAATQAGLSYPQGIAVDAHGNTYVADWGDNEIRRIAPDGSISTVAGSGIPCWSAPSCGDGGAATDAALSFPDGVAVAPDGSVYIADTGDNEIRKVSPVGKVTRFAGNGSECSQPPTCGDGGPATSAQLSAPAAVAVGPSGAVYIADTGDSEVRKVSAAGTITRVAGTGAFCTTAPSCGDSGPAASAQLNYPGGIAFDRAGSLLVADGGDNEVRKVSPGGSMTRVAGSGQQCASPPACGDGGAATSARLNGPDGVAVGPNGAIYIADSADNEVRRVSAAGRIVSIAGTGAACSASTACGDGAPATSAQLNYPDAITLDASGDLCVADTYDAELRWIPAAGSATLTAPTGRVALSAFAASVSAQAVTVRYALGGFAKVALSVGTSVVAHASGRPGFGVLAWKRKLGSGQAPRGRYTLTVTAAAGGNTAGRTLSVRLS